MADIEIDPKTREKLDSFRERAKKSSLDSNVKRVYAEFNSLEEFKDKLGSSLAELKTHLDSAPAASAAATEDPRPQGMPTPPALYAPSPYIGSHRFVGRTAELELLSDWAQPADPTQLLLFEAIGGNGKSMLTWEWTTHHAVAARPADHPWAGRFWYSFYERGAWSVERGWRISASTPSLASRPGRWSSSKRKPPPNCVSPCWPSWLPGLGCYPRWARTGVGGLSPHRCGRTAR